MKDPVLKALRAAGLVLAFCVAVGALGAALQRIFAQSIPGVDLYVFWSAGRALLEGRSPYSPELTAAIQIGIYGHTLGPGQDPMHFAYPPYILLPIWPLLWLTFDWVEALWMSFNLLVGAVCVRLALPRIPVYVLPWIFFAYPFAFGLILGNFAILIFAILMLCLARLCILPETPPQWEQIGLGLLLAWSTGKPQFSWFFILILGINALRRKQFHFLGAFAAGLAALFALAWVMLPGWPMSWIKSLNDYAQSNPVHSPLQDYLSGFVPAGFLSQAVMLGWAVLLPSSVWFVLRWTQARLNLFFLLAWAGAMIFLLNPSGRAYDQIPYWIPVLLYANRQNPKRLVWAFLLLFLIGISWTLFAISKGPYVQAADRWLFLLYLPCLAWLGFHLRTPPSHPAKV